MGKFGNWLVERWCDIIFGWHHFWVADCGTRMLYRYDANAFCLDSLCRCVVAILSFQWSNYYLVRAIQNGKWRPNGTNRFICAARKIVYNLCYEVWKAKMPQFCYFGRVRINLERFVGCALHIYFGVERRKCSRRPNESNVQLYVRENI